MTFNAVGVFGLTFDFLLKICLSILCPPPLLTLPPLHTSPSPQPPLLNSPPPPKSNLVNFDLFWTDSIQNVTTFYINIFLFLRNPI